MSSIPKQFNGRIPKFVAAPCANGNGFQLIDTTGLDQATLSLLAKNLSGKVLTIDEQQAKSSAECNKARMINLIEPPKNFELKNVNINNQQNITSIKQSPIKIQDSVKTPLHNINQTQVPYRKRRSRKKYH